MISLICNFLWFLILICSFALSISKIFIKLVPKNTVYIIDRNTHYLKTVKKGFFLFNSSTDTITTTISTNPITRNYFEVFEAEYGNFYYLIFSVTYYTKNLEDTLYNLEKIRKSVDDILKSCMYFAMLSLRSEEFSKSLLEETFNRNLEGQAMSIGIGIKSFHINSINSLGKQYYKPAFKPHKNYSESKDPIQYL